MELKLVDKVGTIPIDKGTALDRLLERQARLTCKQIVDMFDEQMKGDSYVLDVENIIEQLRTEAEK